MTERCDHKKLTELGTCTAKACVICLSQPRGQISQCEKCAGFFHFCALCQKWLMFPPKTKRDELFNVYNGVGNLNFVSHTKSEAHIMKRELKAASTLLQIRKQECPRCTMIRGHKLSIGCTSCCSIYEHGILIGRLGPEGLLRMFKRDPDHHIGYMGFLLHGGKFAPFQHPVRLPKTAESYKALLGLPKHEVDWEQPGLVAHFKVPFCLEHDLEPLPLELERCKRCKLILREKNGAPVVLGRPFLFSPKELEGWFMQKEVQDIMMQDPLFNGV